MTTDRDPIDPDPIPYATPAPRRGWVGPFAGGILAALILVVAGGALFLMRRTALVPVKTPAPVTPLAPAMPPLPTPVMSLPATSARFSIQQRNLGALPGSSDTIRLFIDDITAGQVQADVWTKDGQHLAGASLERGSGLPFTLNGAGFVIVLVEFHNHLIGQDVAEFVVRPASAPQTQEERIGRLLDLAAESEATVEWPDATGDEPSPRHDRADEPRPLVQYLTEVWQSGAVRTVDGLAQQAARPVSSTSGAPRLRLRNGGHVPLDEWLAEHVKE